jgi:trans-aconitate methyltransferase
MSKQIWRPEKYAANARFVTDLGMPVLKLLAPKPGEHILDLGCGDGILTRKITDLGCTVVGLDSSPEFVSSARKLGLEIVEQDAAEMTFDHCFDAVFSNAALHWMKNADIINQRVARALRSNGRFVGEMGGYGCVQTLQSALIEELTLRGYDGEGANPWYFPTAEEYEARLRGAGFTVHYIALIPRPTRLPGDILGWLTTFGGCFAGVLPPTERAHYFESVRARVRPHLCDTAENWTADYVRLRFAAHLK